MNSTYDPLVGRVLDDRYEILAKLARGGMATVYRARDLRLMRTIAVKVMRRDLGEDDDFAAKFDHEARAAATINHPAVVGVFDQGTAEGQPYIVMEFVEGETLRRRISREAPFAPERALALLEPVVAALACAHEAGLVHRDIKPENVLISSRGQVKVADFGLARLMASPQMTATGVLVGTASYLPPELVTHSRPDSRSDVYSAGVVLFELLTGTKPHTGENNYQIAYRHVNVDIEKPSAALRALHHDEWRVPDYVDAFVAACTARDPNSRPFDGRVMLEQLRRVRRELLAGDRDNPALAADLRPEPSLTGDLTQPIASAPTLRPRPRGASAPAVSGTPTATAHSDDVPVWRPVTPRSPQSPDQPTDRRPPITHAVEDSGRHPRMARTPVFPQFQISRDPVHRRRRGTMLLVLVLLLTAAAGLGSWWFTAGRFTTVPAVGTVSEAVAREAADANDLKVATVSDYSEDVAAGLVISTDPGPGTRVPRGDTLTVVISLGAERFDMPSVVGSDRATATAALEGQNLAVGEVVEAWSDDVAPGVVMTASQRPGTPLKRDTAIDLTVSKGPEPITIKDFADGASTAADARRQLEAAGFTVDVTQENSATVGKGLVISQSPSSGEGKRGDTIALVESLGPVLVDVPDVRYLSVEEATQKLRDLGLEVDVQYSSDFPLSLKIAAGTEPPAGSPVPVGSTVVLLVV